MRLAGLTTISPKRSSEVSVRFRSFDCLPPAGEKPITQQFLQENQGNLVQRSFLIPKDWDRKVSESAQKAGEPYQEHVLTLLMEGWINRQVHSK